MRAMQSPFEAALSAAWQSRQDIIEYERVGFDQQRVTPKWDDTDRWVRASMQIKNHDMVLFGWEIPQLCQALPGTQQDFDIFGSGLHPGC